MIEDLEIIRKRLKKLRDDQDISLQELARRTGLAKSTLQRYETGGIHNLPIDTLDTLAKALNTTSEHILGWEAAPGKYPALGASESQAVKIPVLGYVRAGIPLDAVETTLDYEEISPQMAAQGEFFALQIKGDSMQPRIQDGDVVIVRQQSTIETGEIAVVLVNGDEATVKKIIKQESGILLQPLNPVYEPLFFSLKDIEEKPVQIIGRVVELRGKL